MREKPLTGTDSPFLPRLGSDRALDSPALSERDDKSSATLGKTPTPLRICLTGFMGAGKTTVGALLAARLGWSFVDLDQAITASTSLSVAAFFSTHGEAAFRALELETLAPLLTHQLVVIALGGGSLENPELLTLLFGDPETAVVFLEGPIALLLERCAAQAGAALRPVLAHPAALSDRYAQRLNQYRRARLTLQTGESTPQELAEQIVAGLKLGA